MQFGHLPLNKALGAILAHTIHLNKKVFKKGRVLTAQDIEQLKKAGLNNIVGAILEESDVPENVAAEKIAKSISGEGITLGTPFTGRCNLISNYSGLFQVSPKVINNINLVDESITIGTLPPYTTVVSGQIVSTIKVIPFSAPVEVVDQCISAASNNDKLTAILPWKKLKISLIQSRLSGTKESVLDSTTESLERRLKQKSNTINSETRCTHIQEELTANIITDIKNGHDLIIVASASAIVDRRDIIPSAIIASGGHIEHFGMPVDPGNLLLLGRNGNTKIIGLPGCARSPKFNGFDLVLNRVIADIDINSNDIMHMGIGGLLHEIPSRPMPRSNRLDKDKNKEKLNKLSERNKNIGAIILAAGQSRRMGKKNKLLEELDGKPMISHSIDQVIKSNVNSIVIVTGHQKNEIENTINNKRINFVYNYDYRYGMSTSIKAGIESLPRDIDGALIILGDMPLIDSSLVNKLIDNFDPESGRSIGVPTTKGKRGNPVLWSSQYFPEILNISGDVGARHLIGEFIEFVYEIECDLSVVTDVDTPESLESMSQIKNGSIKN